MRQAHWFFIELCVRLTARTPYEARKLLFKKIPPYLHVRLKDIEAARPGESFVHKSKATYRKPFSGQKFDVLLLFDYKAYAETQAQLEAIRSKIKKDIRKALGPKPEIFRFKVDILD